MSTIDNIVVVEIYTPCVAGVIGVTSTDNESVTKVRAATSAITKGKARGDIDNSP
jgi:hypothetical protein